MILINSVRSSGFLSGRTVIFIEQVEKQSEYGPAPALVYTTINYRISPQFHLIPDVTRCNNKDKKADSIDR
jgi:hypothetical protein